MTELPNSDLIYVTHHGGHRSSYLRALGGGLGLDPYVQRPGIATALALIRARALLFATMEDSLAFFAAVALVRDLLRRPTAAVFMNPRTFFEPANGKTKAKYWLARLLNARRRIAMVSILPHTLDSRHAEISRGWMYDPEFWDLGDVIAKPAPPVPQSLAETLVQIGHKPYLLFAGRIDGTKGFDFFVQGLREARALGLDCVFVAAGPLAPGCARQAAQFEELGGVLINRFLADEELLALQRSARCLWACYRPDYNSSSGIFGRAVQLGQCVVVNHGSYLDRLALLLEVSAVRCRYGNGAELRTILRDLFSTPSAPAGDPTGNTQRRLFSLAQLRNVLS